MEIDWLEYIWLTTQCLGQLCITYTYTYTRTHHQTNWIAQPYDTSNDKYIREFIECALSYRFTCSASVDIKPIKLRNRASISWASSLSSPIQFHWLFVTDTKKNLSYRRAGYCATWIFIYAYVLSISKLKSRMKTIDALFDKIWKVWINMRSVLIGSTSVSARKKWTL